MRASKRSLLITDGNVLPQTEPQLYRGCLANLKMPTWSFRGVVTERQSPRFCVNVNH